MDLNMHKLFDSRWFWPSLAVLAPLLAFELRLQLREAASTAVAALRGWRDRSRAARAAALEPHPDEEHSRPTSEEVMFWMLANVIMLSNYGLIKIGIAPWTGGHWSDWFTAMAILLCELATGILMIKAAKSELDLEGVLATVAFVGLTVVEAYVAYHRGSQLALAERLQAAAQGVPVLGDSQNLAGGLMAGLGAILPVVLAVVGRPYAAVWAWYWAGTGRWFGSLPAAFTTGCANILLWLIAILSYVLDFLLLLPAVPVYLVQRIYKFLKGGPGAGPAPGVGGDGPKEKTWASLPALLLAMTLAGPAWSSQIHTEAVLDCTGSFRAYHSRAVEALRVVASKLLPGDTLSVSFIGADARTQTRVGPRLALENLNHALDVRTVSANIRLRRGFSESLGGARPESRATDLWQTLYLVLYDLSRQPPDRAKRLLVLSDTQNNGAPLDPESLPEVQNLEVIFAFAAPYPHESVPSFLARLQTIREAFSRYSRVEILTPGADLTMFSARPASWEENAFQAVRDRVMRFFQHHSRRWRP